MPQLHRGMGGVSSWTQTICLHCEFARKETRPNVLTCVTLHITLWINDSVFRHAGLERFFKRGSKAGIQPAHAQKLNVLLTNLNLATKPQNMDLAGWGLHELKGDLRGHWSVKVNGNWRMTFRFEVVDAILVDYH